MPKVFFVSLRLKKYLYLFQHQNHLIETGHIDIIKESNQILGKRKKKKRMGVEDLRGSFRYIPSCLTIVVVGGSGDLAKKKTFPSLLNLYVDGLLPKDTKIWAYARSDTSSEALREKIHPYLNKEFDPKVVENFLSIVHYHKGSSYGDLDAFKQLSCEMEAFECAGCANRLFYFAIPPNVFGETGYAIKQTCMQQEEKGWTRLIVEKPFGKDLESFEKLHKDLSSQFTEDHLYRIDHYLGKEMVQNLTVIRFSNMWFERIVRNLPLSTLYLDAPSIDFPLWCDFFMFGLFLTSDMLLLFYQFIYSGMLIMFRW